MKRVGSISPDESSTRFTVPTAHATARTQCYEWTKPDTLEFKWKNNHSREMPLPENGQP